MKAPPPLQKGQMQAKVSWRHLSTTEVHMGASLFYFNTQTGTNTFSVMASEGCDNDWQTRVPVCLLKQCLWTTLPSFDRWSAQRRPLKMARCALVLDIVDLEEQNQCVCLKVRRSLSTYVPSSFWLGVSSFSSISPWQKKPVLLCLWRLDCSIQHLHNLFCLDGCPK